MKLGKMEPVDLREVWKHEALDFTKWMAMPENLEYLNNKIGLSLVDIQTEKNVGGYKCDIVCRDEFTNKIVIIENQLENTNHDHLGKIITYASGLGASVIIWIVKEAREEHASAIEWLNNHTDESLSFFLMEVQLWKIGNSEPALQLNIIEQPNDFNKSLKKSVQSGAPSENQMNKQEFWTVFNEVMRERNEFNIRKASTDHWYDFSVGTSACHFTVELLNKEKKVRVNMWIPDDKNLFDMFLSHKEAVELAIGEKLIWDRMDAKKGSRICTYIDGFSFSKPENYSAVSNRMIDKLVLFRKAFKPLI